MRNQRNMLVLWVIGLVLLAGLLVLLSWSNHRYTTTHTESGTDFQVYWTGTRSFLGEGISPYSREVTGRIAEAIYGRPARANEFQPYWYSPLFMFIPFIPFSMISDYALARALWMTLLEAAILGTVFLSIRLTGWRVHWLVLGLALLFSVFWFHGLRPLVDGSPVILVTLLFTAALNSIRDRADESAGVLLGLCMIKPLLIALPLAFIFIWALLNRRGKMIVWFAMTVFLLGAVSALLLPDWILQNAAALVQNEELNLPGTPAAAVAVLWPALGERVGSGFSIIVGVMVLVEWWFARHAEFRGLLWTTCLTLVASQWVGIPTEPENFFILLLPLILVFATWDERWPRMGGILSGISMALLFAGIWWIYRELHGSGYVLVLSPVLLLPAPLFLLAGLYWVRWWAVNPPAVWYDFLVSARR